MHSQPNKWGDMAHREPSIAIGVLQPFLIWLYQEGKDCSGILQPLISHILWYIIIFHCQKTPKCQIWISLLGWKIGWWGKLIAICVILKCFKPCLSAYIWSEKLLGESFSLIRMEHGLHRAIITNNSTKIWVFWCTLSLINGIIWHKESHPLLLNCFKPFLNAYIRRAKLVDPSNSPWVP